MGRQPKKQSIDILTYSLDIYEKGNSPTLYISQRQDAPYSDVYDIRCHKPLSVQTGKQLVLGGDFIVSIQQIVDQADENKVVLSPYHIGWKVEPNMELFISNNIIAYGSSGHLSDTEFKMVLLNKGSSIFNTVANDVVASLQFYLVPRLQLRRYKIQ